MPFHPTASSHIAVVVVGPDDEVLPAQGPAPDPVGAGQLLAEGVVVVLGAQAAQQPHAEGRLEVAALPAAAHVRERAGSVPVEDVLQPGGDLVQGLVPGYFLEAVADPLQGVGQPVGVVLVMDDVQPLAAGVALAAGVFLVRPHLDHAVVGDLDFEAAVLRAEHAARFVPLGHPYLPGVVRK